MDLSNLRLFVALFVLNLLSGINGQWFGGFGFGGLFPNPLAIWAYGGPGIGAAIPDAGLMGVSGQIRDLPQQNPPPAAAAAVALTSLPSAAAADASFDDPSMSNISPVSNSSETSLPVGIRSVSKNVKVSGNAIKSPPPLSLSDKKAILNISIAALAKQILAERSRPLELAKSPKKLTKAAVKTAL